MCPTGNRTTDLSLRRLLEPTVVTRLIPVVVKKRVRVPPVLWPRIWDAPQYDLLEHEPSILVNAEAEEVPQEGVDDDVI